MLGIVFARWAKKMFGRPKSEPAWRFVRQTRHKNAGGKPPNSRMIKGLKPE